MDLSLSNGAKWQEARKKKQGVSTKVLNIGRKGSDGYH